MASAPGHVIELIFGCWRSQALYAGAALGVFDHLAENRSTDAPALAPQVGADLALLWRLLRTCRDRLARGRRRQRLSSSPPQKNPTSRGEFKRRGIFDALRIGGTVTSFEIASGPIFASCENAR